VTPSRLVENLYWLGRYTVRCEDKARILRSTLAVRVDSRQWQHALQLCRALGAVAEHTDPSRAMRDDGDARGLPADVRRLAACASQARNYLSARHWRGVVGLQRQVQEAVASRSGGYEPLERLLLSIAALTGFMEEDMTHDDGWRLMRIGRRIERLCFVANLLACHLYSEAGNTTGAVDWLLDVCDSRIVYRARYRAIPRNGPMLDLLLRDAEHPMALAFLHGAIGKDLEALAQALGTERDAVRMSLPLPLLVDADLERLEDNSDAGIAARTGLAHELQGLAVEAATLSDRLSRRHFSHVDSDTHAFAV
jgi:uncharacterized alpha-E superfamily protein